MIRLLLKPYSELDYMLVINLEYSGSAGIDYHLIQHLISLPVNKLNGILFQLLQYPSLG